MNSCLQLQADPFIAVTVGTVPKFLDAFTDDRVGVIQVTQSLNISLPLDAVLRRHKNLTIQPHPSAAGAYPILTFLPQPESPTFMWLPPRVVLVVQGLELVGVYQPEALTDNSPPIFGGGTLHFYNTVLHQPVCLPASAPVSLPQAAHHNYSNTQPVPLPSPPPQNTTVAAVLQNPQQLRAILVEQFQIQKQLGMLPSDASISDLVNKALNSTNTAGSAPASPLGQSLLGQSALPSNLANGFASLGSWAETAFTGALQAVQNRNQLGSGSASAPANGIGINTGSESGGSNGGVGNSGASGGGGVGDGGSGFKPSGSESGQGQAAPAWGQLTGQLLGQIATALDPPPGQRTVNVSSQVVPGSDLDSVLHAGQHAPFCINHTMTSASGTAQQTCYASYMPLDGVTTIVTQHDGPYYNGTGGVQPYHPDISITAATSIVKYSSSVMVCDSVNTDCQGLQGSNRTSCLLRQQLGQQLALPDGDPPSITDGGVISITDGVFLPNQIEVQDPNNTVEVNPGDSSDTGNSSPSNSVVPSNADAGANGLFAALEAKDYTESHEGRIKRRTLVLALLLGGVLPLLFGACVYLTFYNRARVTAWILATRGLKPKESSQDLEMPPLRDSYPAGTAVDQKQKSGTWEDDACHEAFSENQSPTDSSSQPTITILSSARTISGQPQHGAASIVVKYQLGAGSFGRVFCGEWEGQEVAVKLISHSTAAEAARVGNEVALSMRFKHPNVVRCLYFEIISLPPGVEPSVGLPHHRLDSDSSSGSSQMQQRRLAGGVGLLNSAGSRNMNFSKAETWIVLELCNSDSLSAHMEAGSLHALLGLSKTAHTLAGMLGVLTVALDIAQGMEYVHGMSVCHGDLSAGNVLLHKDQSGLLIAKVADFGLSRSLGDGFSAISTQTLGTVLFMPPELMSTGQLRSSADVYSFGILLYCMLAGQMPYSGLRFPEVVFRVTSMDLRPQLPENTPVQLRALAEACWHKNALARPTFSAVCQQLQCMLEAGAYDLRQQEVAAAAGADGVIGGVSFIEEQDAAVLASWAQAAAIALM